MRLLKSLLRSGFEILERVFDRVFGPRWNPFHNLGALGFFYYWLVAVSGIYVYIFFDTGVTEAYDSVERLTHAQWYLGGVMRSFHRYASDGLVLMLGVHMLREFSLDRYRGVRWFTWVTGMPIVWLVIISGITGYWLVWDTLGQYVAIATAELLDSLPIFGEPIARNFLTPDSLDDRFFTLMVFIHIAVPLILLFILWIHLQRVSRPRINPPRGLAVGTFVMMLGLALVRPAESQGPANLDVVTAEVGLDWFYLWGYPLIDLWGVWTWVFAGVMSLMLAVLPWLPPMRKTRPAVVHLQSCNGCTRCAEDCPYNAIAMRPRSDGLPFDWEAVVRTDHCVACGICAGACPTAMPFRRRSALIPGIELADRSVADLREHLEATGAALAGDRRVLIVGCDHGPLSDRFKDGATGVLTLPCIGALPPSFIDYALSRGLADGVLLTGCGDGECFNRFGIHWTEQRIGGRRDPKLRERVPRERIATCWAARNQPGRVQDALETLRAGLANAGAQASRREARQAVEVGADA